MQVLQLENSYAPSSVPGPQALPAPRPAPAAVSWQSSGTPTSELGAGRGRASVAPGTGCDSVRMSSKVLQSAGNYALAVTCRGPDCRLEVSLGGRAKFSKCY